MNFKIINKYQKIVENFNLIEKKIISIIKKRNINSILKIIYYFILF